MKYQGQAPSATDCLTGWDSKGVQGTEFSQGHTLAKKKKSPFG